ncbi:hypothetical protein [Sphingomonas sp. BK580]|uniref:hypothetical protein n=1 Tax=Sphingomonas sp. BK580 TaxID=2586972 RepID=UPI0016075460|nr:hypothetical protein [Sphingomonas sp. BK580]MBB3694771.1 hypothetical protein [Sphingomonas sp. BK580]
MTALTPLLSSSSLAPAAAPTTRATLPAAVTPPAAPAPDRSIGARVDSQVAGGALSADAGASLKDFFGETGAGSTGSLIRRAGAQLDQFDRVLDKLRASLGNGATYGGAAPGSSGMVVDRLA